VGDYVYIKEMALGPFKSKKFRDKWRAPYLVTQRISDRSNQIQIKPGKRVVVNVNRMKKCYSLPTRNKVTRYPPQDSVPAKKEQAKHD
jgi:hypothetical protein